MNLLYIMPFACIRYMVFSLLPLRSALSRSKFAFLQLTMDELFIAVEPPVPALCQPHALPLCACMRTSPHSPYAAPCVLAFQGLCCCTRPVLLYITSLCWNYKYLILHRVIACYCHVYKNMVVPYKDYNDPLFV